MKYRPVVSCLTEERELGGSGFDQTTPKWHRHPNATGHHQQTEPSAALPSFVSWGQGRPTASPCPCPAKSPTIRFFLKPVMSSLFQTSSFGSGFKTVFSEPEMVNGKMTRRLLDLYLVLDFRPGLQNQNRLKSCSIAIIELVSAYLIPCYSKVSTKWKSFMWLCWRLTEIGSKIPLPEFLFFRNKISAIILLQLQLLPSAVGADQNSAGLCVWCGMVAAVKSWTPVPECPHPFQPKIA